MTQVSAKRINMIVAYLLGVSISAHSVETPVGMMGGGATDAWYAEQLTDFNGTVAPVSNLSSTSGIVTSVAINNSGLSLIGANNIPYAAFVLPNGNVTSLNLPFSSGFVNQVAINQSGLGLVGGALNPDSPYVAYVSTDGTINEVTVSPYFDFEVESVALNDSGVGLAGGEGSALPTAVYVNTSGTVTPISLRDTGGRILAVDINASGNGIVAGRIVDNSGSIYAAFVSPNGTSTDVTGLPQEVYPGNFAAAINNSGAGLIGGQDNNGNAYAAFIPTNAVAAPLFSTPFAGNIFSVDINDSGVGLMGGVGNSDSDIGYAALMRADRSLQTLSLPAGVEIVTSVALNKQGIGLLGGAIGDGGYAALMAPNGTLTQLDVGADFITSVALADGEPIIEQAVPTSAGLYLSSIYTQLAASSALSTRFVQKNRIWNDPCDCSCTEGPTSVWLSPFANYTSLQREGVIPQYSNQIYGGLVGVDREGRNYLIGVAGGYAFDRVHYAHERGHANLNEEMVALYGVYYTPYFWIASSLWGGLSQARNVRNTLFEGTDTRLASRANIYGSVLSPHLEIASPWNFDCLPKVCVEPFVALDWVNVWQNHFSEFGDSGFNLQVPCFYGSLLQSEIGARFYEKFCLSCGSLCLEQKVSYINQAPFNFNHVGVLFEGSTVGFPLALGPSRTQNLAAIELSAAYLPDNCCAPYFGLSLQAAAGSAYQAYQANLFVGIDF